MKNITVMRVYGFHWSINCWIDLFNGIGNVAAQVQNTGTPCASLRISKFYFIPAYSLCSCYYFSFWWPLVFLFLLWYFFFLLPVSLLFLLRPLYFALFLHSMIFVIRIKMFIFVGLPFPHKIIDCLILFFILLYRLFVYYSISNSSTNFFNRS